MSMIIKSQAKNFHNRETILMRRETLKASSKNFSCRLLFSGHWLDRV